MAEVREQVMVGVREAAQLARVSTKQIRKWIAEGKVRAELAEGKFGPTWSIEASSLPLAPRPMERGIPGVGQALPVPPPRGEEEDSRGGAGAVQALVAMLSDLQRRHEGAVARLGQLEGEREQRLALEERARSLVEREAQARAEAEQVRTRVQEAQSQVEQLSVEVSSLRESVKWRTWVAGIALAASVISLSALLGRLLYR